MKSKKEMNLAITKTNLESPLRLFEIFYKYLNILLKGNAKKKLD